MLLDALCWKMFLRGFFTAPGCVWLADAALVSFWVFAAYRMGGRRGAAAAALGFVLSLAALNFLV